MKHLLYTSLLVLTCSSSFSQTVVNPYSPGVTPQGITYFLPRTVLRATVQVERTTYQPGDFCKYAERYLKMSDVECDPVITFKINSIRLSTFGTPDRKKCYTVKFDAKSYASNIKLTEDGILLAINSEAQMPIAKKPFVSAQKAEQTDPHTYLTEDILAAGSTAKMAELTAQEIYDIRDSKNQLTRGEADYMPKDGEQLKLMLHKLDIQERSLTQLFSGTIVKDTMENVVTFSLDTVASDKILFRFSKKLGFTDADDLAGSPYYISIEDEHSVPAQNDNAAKKQKKPDNGVYINIPSKVKVRIYNHDQELASGEFTSAQQGNTEILSDKLFNKKYTTHVVLDPTTGGLIKIDAEQFK
jgi:hypothetical protein